MTACDLRYCPRCVLPSTRPNLRFDDQGNCNCATREKKRAIDWTAREAQFRTLVATVKAQDRAYDCVIPVSGGKDSTWQALKCLEYGLRPLAVTWRTPARNPLGQANLDNLIRLGLDHIDFSINPRVERVFTLAALERHGTPALPMHMALFAIPLRLALNYDIPLVVWGENSAFEYGGDDEAVRGHRMSRDWLKKYGVTNGTTAEDWVGETLSLKDLTPYRWPSDAELAAKDVSAVFLGHYFEWDPVAVYEAVRGHGFQAMTGKPKTGYYAFADVDDDFLITIHHWIKWYKFGFTRLWDNLSLEIRNGRLSRDEALRIIAERGDERPDAEIDALCAYLGIARERFFAILERFRNRDLWTQGPDGAWRIDGFLIPDWVWTNAPG